MANQPLDSGLIFLYAKHTDLSGGTTYQLVACLLDSNLQRRKTEEDASSKCGQYTFAGSDDDTFTATIQLLAAAAEAGSVGQKELMALYEDKETVDWMLADAITGATKLDIKFSGIMTQFDVNLPQRGVATASLTVKPSGAIVQAV